MLWNSLRAGCGNLGPFLGLSLLVLIAAAPLVRQQHSPQAAVPGLLQAYNAAAPAVNCELSAAPLSRFTI